MELNFEQTRKASDDESAYDETGVITRGGKAFVDMMKGDSLAREPELFDNEEYQEEEIEYNE